MSECTFCHGQAQLFLCPACISELRDMLTSLAHGGRQPHGELAPGWLEVLEDAAQGRVRLGDTQQLHGQRYWHHLDGEMPLAELLEPYPYEDTRNLAKARHDRAQGVLRRALGRARINLRASEKMIYTRSVLLEWTLDIQPHKGPGPLRTTADLALWLARHVNRIAADEAAAVCYAEISEIIRDIERIVDRPTPLRFCGPCPSIDEHQMMCATGLYARLGATEIQCWKCKITHDVKNLITDAIEDADELLYSAREVHIAMATIGLPIPPRTWRDWRMTHKIPIRGWIGTEPRYWLKDAKDLLEAKPQKVPTGAAAHERNAAPVTIVQTCR